jgi:hypothetical protein
MGNRLSASSRRTILGALLCFILLSLTAFAPLPQNLPNTISLVVEAGFTGYFRDTAWMPIQIRATNDGEDVSGLLVVRPETSGDAITNTYSTPLSLPANARQTAFLYITARAYATQIRVEFIDDNGVVLAAERATVRGIRAQDRLYVVVSESPLGTVDMSGAKIGSFDAFQADWEAADLPERAAALDAVDMMLFNEVDTSALSAAQVQAIEDWVITGGHLVVAGGASWQATAAGLGHLLPLTPTGSETVEGLPALGEWLRLPTDDLNDQTVIATGELLPNAQTLVSTEDGLPLITRRSIGAGTVDYLSADPNAAPLRHWGRMADLWFALATTAGTQPGWSQGVVDWESAAQAVEILPGFDPLPDVLPLCGFLALYIALIGPLNYLILSRLNRREWAWITIPALIIVFSVFAWVVGFNLRGNEATLNQLTVVRSWPDAERARVDGVVGLLSPRRTQYDLNVTSDNFVNETLRPIPRAIQTGSTLLTRDVQTSVDIRQTDRFQAADFTVDASFIAGFNLSAMIDRPPISGLASIAYNALDGQQTIRGSVRNDSDVTLKEPVILARGVAVRLDKPLEPGEVATFDVTLPGGSVPSPALYTPSVTTRFLSFRNQAVNNKRSVFDILGNERYDERSATWRFFNSPEEQVERRRLLFLNSLIDDPYGATGRGENIYLAGWADTMPLTLGLEGANWNTQSLTLYLIELETQQVAPTDSVVVIPPDQFTWVVREHTGLGEVTPISLVMQPGEEIVFQYTPLPGSVLRTVDNLKLEFVDVNSGGRTIPVQLWDWQAETWEDIDVTAFTHTITEPERFIGPQNAVQLRMITDQVGGYLRASRLVVEQTGSF